MNVKGNHPLSEIIARCMSGVETVPNDCMRRMVNRACREAVKYHKAALQSHNTGSPKLPLDYLDVESELNAKSRTLFEYSHYEQGVKDCYKLLERQLRASA